MQIAARCVASFHYTLTNDAGDVLDSSQGREPLAYLHDAGNIVPGLERAMSGRQAGDRFVVDVAAEDGYMPFQAQTAQGVIDVVVTVIEGDEVTVDGNHPLAGETLHFEVEVVEVRAATAEEISHGHVHGAGGHHHH
jgi:FKBP-type peptidyl-prolyl cis-trans isomerase SlyD